MTKTGPTPMERMSAAHAANADNQAKERKAELVALFKPDERLEKLLRIRTSDSALFATFGPTVRISLGMYVQQREAAGYTGDDGDDAA